MVAIAGLGRRRKKPYMSDSEQDDNLVFSLQRDGPLSFGSLAYIKRKS
jgi:hypothetical protein